MAEKPFKASDSPNFLKGRIKSFQYAYRGIVYTFKTQKNAWIHLGITGLVLFLGLFLGLSTEEWALIILCISGVLVAETFNTALETMVDLVSPEYHALAGRAKDIASGAVLLSALGAASIGLLIFIPKIWHFFYL